jgi:antitoxin component YwqK of YwqJK toxin-antitoxin module
MNSKIFYLSHKDKALKYIQLLLFLIILGCENDQSFHSRDWNGTESDFTESFKVMESGALDSGMPFLLVDRESGSPYTGDVERTGINHSTSQNYLNGLLSGKSVKMSPDGSWVEAHYLNGQLHGPMTFHDAEGKVRSKMSYETGKLVLGDSK